MAKHCPFGESLSPIANAEGISRQLCDHRDGYPATDPFAEGLTFKREPRRAIAWIVPQVPRAAVGSTRWLDHGPD